MINRDGYSVPCTVLLFLLGLFSETKVFLFGCIAISELVVFFVAPIVFFCLRREMFHRGFGTFLYMACATIAAMLFSSWVNGTAFVFVLKSFASMYSIVAYYIVFYALLRRSLKYGLGWFFVGEALSLMIIIYALNPVAEVSSEGFGYMGTMDTEFIVNSQLFWVQRVKALMQLPIVFVYLKCPLGYSILTPLLFTVFTLFTSVSGRSASLSILLFGAMVVVGRKSRRAMRNMGRHTILFFFGAVAVVYFYKGVYNYLAQHGWLGNDAQSKYEIQTRGGKGGIIQLLMSGRKEFFIGIPAALDKPILGHGPFAEDRDRYTERFMVQYGEPDDIELYYKIAYHNLLSGHISRIPTHSHIIGAWVHYGIVGLIFWLWILYLIFQHIRHYADAIPQWYGYFALYISSYLWHIFFSPLGSRHFMALFIVCLFFARAIGKKKMTLPIDMEFEARKYD